MGGTSKALLIAAAVLVAIIIIAFGLKIFKSSNASETATDVGKTIDEKTQSATGTASSSISNLERQFFPTGDPNNEGIENMSLQQGQTATVNSPYISNNKKAIIPAGYTVSNVEAETKIDNGLVIKKDENEWVWIPVSPADLAEMYTEDSTGWKMSGTTVVTNYKTKGTLARVNPGDTSSFREPDVLNNNSYDKKASNLSNAGLGANIGEAATKLRDDYKAMIDSVKKYGGFYVGRYELSSAGTQKDKATLNLDWYGLYKKCRDIEKESDTVVTTMIFGCQWDQICKFISTSGDKVNLSDSSKYGNYCNSKAPANEGNWKYYTKRNTGSNEAWKVNNIYDFAGNCWEWTQEVLTTNTRANNGGSYGDYGATNPVTYRASYRPNFPYTSFGSRPVLYIK